jgi:hypothetical protein
MTLWRSKKRSQEAGRLAQICVWAPETEAELARQLCTRVAEPTERGEKLRGSLFQQLHRRRTICYEWHGFTTRVEIDYPFVGRWWSLKNIGGRILGPLRTHVELSPDEAAALRERLNRCCQREVEAWLKENDLLDRVRDDTGVVTGDDATEDPNRPADETAFAANEARIAREVLEAAWASRKPPMNHPSIVEFEGVHGFPSFCQIAHRKQDDRVQFALIHMNNGGTSPTNMFESLATHLRQRFYPKVDAGKIDWYDVQPAEVYTWRPLTILSVTMQHANGVYSDPAWHKPNDFPEDWLAIITDIIVRGEAARKLVEDAPPPSTKASTNTKRRS